MDRSNVLLEAGNYKVLLPSLSDAVLIQEVKMKSAYVKFI